MTSTSIEELVCSYWTYYGLSTSDQRTDRLRAADWRWAFDDVEEAVAVAGDCLPLLVALAEKAPTDAALSYLGAGEIEDLIRASWNDAVVVDRVVGWADRSEHFRQALGGVWYPDEVPEPVRRRLITAAKVLP